MRCLRVELWFCIKVLLLNIRAQKTPRSTDDNMATAFFPAATQYPQPVACGPRQCVRGDPKDAVPVPYHQPLEESTHASLQVQGPVSPTPEHFSVNIFNGSKRVKVSVMVRSTDTIGKLLQNSHGNFPNLAYNGKPVELKQTLSELQVKPGATFLAFQKCIGG